MAFLDNSGDIILDAVLTDTGRLRLSQGDGSFKITKFALGDDEINYGLYDKSHASGSAYYDLQILQTPVLEAFTNNTSNLNTKLMSISRTNLLYMPTLKLAKFGDVSSLPSEGGFTTGQLKGTEMYNGRSANEPALNNITWKDTRYVVAADNDTYNYIRNGTNGSALGTGANQNSNDIGEVIQGYTPPAQNGATPGPRGQFILVHQGLDTNAVNASAGLDGDLFESQYMLEMDYRLSRLAPLGTHNEAAVNFIDDDNIATYYITEQAYVKNNPSTSTIPDSKKAEDTHGEQIFAGPRGSMLAFRLKASPELQYSTYLYTQIGSSEALTGLAATNTWGFPTEGPDGAGNLTAYWIDTTVRLVGANTGARLDIPVRFVKIQ
tara:strand:+ start:617 stop:1753 length:1137 start_codon:yes stop_codon:yes gene_type:complete